MTTAQAVARRGAPRCAVITLSLLLTCCTSAVMAEETLTGRVVRVVDGDTFTLRTREYKDLVVRVAEIDAPERDQPYGQESRRRLTELVLHKPVRLSIQTLDTNGRTVARPYVGVLDVAAELVRDGAAWVYVHYAKDPALPLLEAQALAAKRGVWRLPESERVPPWEWRRARNGRSPPLSTNGDQHCAIKGNLSSNGERIYHLPDQENYEETRISVKKGERWFCSESEALAAGWRKARTR